VNLVAACQAAVCPSCGRHGPSRPLVSAGPRHQFARLRPACRADDARQKLAAVLGGARWPPAAQAFAAGAAANADVGSAFSARLASPYDPKCASAVAGQAVTAACAPRRLPQSFVGAMPPLAAQNTAGASSVVVPCGDNLMADGLGGLRGDQAQMGSLHLGRLAEAANQAAFFFGGGAGAFTRGDHSYEFHHHLRLLSMRLMAATPGCWNDARTSCSGVSAGRICGQSVRLSVCSPGATQPTASSGEGADTRAAVRAAIEGLQMSADAGEREPPPGALRVPLLCHQKVALAWMCKREAGQPAGELASTGSVLRLGSSLAHRQGNSGLPTSSFWKTLSWLCVCWGGGDPLEAHCSCV
jgi:hypothetical protein